MKLCSGEMGFIWGACQSRLPRWCARRMELLQGPSWGVAGGGRKSGDACVGLGWRAGGVLWTQGCLWQPQRTHDCRAVPATQGRVPHPPGHLSPALSSAPTSVPPQPPALQRSGIPSFPTPVLSENEV